MKSNFLDIYNSKAELNFYSFLTIPLFAAWLYQYWYLGGKIKDGLLMYRWVGVTYSLLWFSFVPLVIVKSIDTWGEYSSLLEKIVVIVFPLIIIAIVIMLLIVCYFRVLTRKPL